MRRVLLSLAVLLIVVQVNSIEAALAEDPSNAPSTVGTLLLRGLQGDANAQSALGDLFANSNDSDEAKTWYERAARQGDAHAQFELARLLAQLMHHR